MSFKNIELVPLQNIPLVTEGDDISSLILQAIQYNSVELLDEDIIVIAHTIISKAEGRVIERDQISISENSKLIAEDNGFDPAQVEVAINESQEVLRSKRALITRLGNGHICNFSGVDRSNAPPGMYILLPVDADDSAERIRTSLYNSTGKSLAIIISDTEGRPWRRGAINLAIGCAGINAFKYNEGKQDLYDRVLQHSLVCQIDEIASAAELLMGQANEGIPIVIVRGYEYEKGVENSRDVHRALDENLFR